MTATCNRRDGSVITFYSYKGGTGRTMALANTACLLARDHIPPNERVLVIDWDLEAPGLHRYFDLHTPPSGLLELMEDAWSIASGEDGLLEEDCAALFERLDPGKHIIQTSTGLGVDMLPAGKQGRGYANRLSKLNWEGLYQAIPWFFRRFAGWLTARYRYVLIDSRTGITDISSICTTLMPETLVLVFTPNRQSLTGVLELVQTATEYRRESDDLRPLMIFPLPSRVEATEPRLLERWRDGSEDSTIEGYQPGFERVLCEAYGLDQCDLSKYLDEVQIQHVPAYAFGEEIAVLTETRSHSLSLSGSYERFARRLVMQKGPWEDRTYYRVYIHHSSPLPQLQRVLNLANQLRADGVDAWVDLYETSPPSIAEWPEWVRRQILRADEVLLIWTGSLHTWDHILLELIERPIVVVIFNAAARQELPDSLKKKPTYLLPGEYESLYRHLTRQPRFVPPKLGAVRRLPMAAAGED